MIRYLLVNVKAPNFYTLTALESRHGEIIVEVVHGTVLDDEGNGQLDSGYYIKYHTGKKGDRIESIFVYNGNSTALDYIEYRQDTILK